MVFDRILRAGEGRTLKKLKVIADQVNSIEDEFTKLSDAELRAMTDELRQRHADGETLDELLPEAFATVREAAKRTIQQRHYDVQIMGGASLHLGNISEMKTGEGKTLTSSLPAYLNALTGKGVHIVTVNDYLARRDAEWGARVHGFLGLTVGVISPQMSAADRRANYACDITYGTNAEFGFDYLRDNMAWSNEELVQRGHNFAIVDEVDSILIDEARTPLIISGPSDQPTRWYAEFARVVARLTPEVDYEVDEGKRTVGITDDGIAKVEDQLGIENLYESANTPLVGYLNNAIKAKELYKKDKDYIVVQGEVLIVDEFTGRVLAGRRYSEGMHQAIEAKESVEIKQENQTLATITLQNFFRLYDKLSGMTGTAMTEAAEFDQIYKLGVVQIPTNRDMVRKDLNDVIYKTEVAKFDAVVEDIAERHTTGQPILIGTTSVQKSEYLSGLLLKRGIAHTVLNAKQHDREAHTIAEAGRKGAVTVSTNMAGRGTDIMLGGNPEHLATEALHAQGLNAFDDPEGYEAAWPAALAKAKAEVSREHEEVVALGGLYVLGTERHESRRIDNQLRGRSGRQGDPGESKFYLSLGDDLMRMFNGAMVENIMNRLNIPDDVPIETKIVSNSIRSAQTQVEGQNFEIRKNVLKYDEVMNKQRHVIYEDRRRVLEGADLEDQVRHMIDDTVAAYVTGATADGFPEDWDLKTLWSGLGALYPLSIPYEQIDAQREKLDADELLERLQEDAQSAYDRRTEQVGEEAMRELERRVVLSVLDRKWREHLYEMDYLQEGIGLRAMGQRDPLVEYQREGYDMFMAMQDAIKEESFGFLFNVEVVTEEAEPEPTIEITPAPSIQLNPEPTPAPAAEQTLGAPVAPEVIAADPAGEAFGEAAVSATAAPVAPAAYEPSVPQTPAAPAEVAQPVAPAAPAAPAAYEPAPVNTPAPAAPAAPRTVLPDFTPNRPANLQYTAPSEDGSASTTNSVAGQSPDGGPSRNGPCPCGSGRKYKRCHGGPGGE